MDEINIYNIIFLILKTSMTLRLYRKDKSKKGEDKYD